MSIFTNLENNFHRGLISENEYDKYIQRTIIDCEIIMVNYLTTGTITPKDMNALCDYAEYQMKEAQYV